MKDSLKIRINKPGLNLELESKKPSKHMETLRCLLSDINDIGQDIKTIKRDDNREEEELMEDIFEGKSSRYTADLLKFKPAKLVIDRLEETCEMNRQYKIIADVKQSIDLKTKKSRRELDLDSWKKAMQKELYGLKIMNLQAAIIHVIGKKIHVDDIKKIKEATLRHLNYPPCTAFMTEKDLGSKIVVEIALFGTFQKTAKEMMWDD